ncbi:hypothetical protein N0V90_013546 [Kalmusia sp. IMI 367209]|nr:hypothetical protein N0V90_013546 [Kalmusia sp. IMI 367209]
MSQYRELDVAKNEIRLVCLLPSLNKASPIKCELFYISLDRPASERFYEALSYTWGGSAAAHTILLNNGQFDVTDNLHAALLELRLEKQPRYLWVDAICINQFDVLERNREVLRMLGIYQNAQQVVVWLGTDIPYTGSAMDHLIHLERKWREQSTSTFIKRSIGSFTSLFGDITLFLEAAIRTIWTGPNIRVLLIRCAIHSVIHWYIGNLLWSGIFFLLIIYQSLLPAIAEFIQQMLHNINEVSSTRLVADGPEPPLLNALKDIFEKEWFGRVWIIQEIAAASHAVVQCGKKVLALTS